MDFISTIQNDKDDSASGIHHHRNTPLNKFFNLIHWYQKNTFSNDKLMLY